MTDDLSLFGDGPAPLPEPVLAPVSIPDWQIELLRKALDSRGLTSMAERQQAIQSAAGRPVESLRALTHDEGLRVLSVLGQRPRRSASDGSAWDDRDEDTWIDRL
ncbi:hypothetical protein [Nocardioides sp. Soil805]|uniref:hypothetical protein n=1 Tax=Nocardioides sp. Soil805 TaxID=1736416 RepID=UPI0012E359D5|nr:hypothetical protein [Nocardioides sp. Soil805]